MATNADSHLQILGEREIDLTGLIDRYPSGEEIQTDHDSWRCFPYGIKTSADLYMADFFQERRNRKAHNTYLTVIRSLHTVRAKIYTSDLLPHKLITEEAFYPIASSEDAPRYFGDTTNSQSPYDISQKAFQFAHTVTTAGLTLPYIHDLKKDAMLLAEEAYAWRPRKYDGSTLDVLTAHYLAYRLLGGNMKMGENDFESSTLNSGS